MGGRFHGALEECQKGWKYALRLTGKGIVDRERTQVVGWIYRCSRPADNNSRLGKAFSTFLGQFDYRCGVAKGKAGHEYHRGTSGTCLGGARCDGGTEPTVPGEKRDGAGFVRQNEMRKVGEPAGQRKRTTAGPAGEVMEGNSYALPSQDSSRDPGTQRRLPMGCGVEISKRRYDYGSLHRVQPLELSYRAWLYRLWSKIVDMKCCGEVHPTDRPHLKETLHQSKTERITKTA
jgi:hypothetical protein